MRVLLIDHEDSFVHNLAQSFGTLGADVRCVRYTTTAEQALRAEPEAIVFSPGPGHPRDRRITGLARTLLHRRSGRVPILGVCLGHQLIADDYGGQVVHASRPVHGETAEIHHDGSTLFHKIPNPFRAARYHSLVVSPSGLPSALTVTAQTSSGVVMGMEDSGRRVFGVQFHPESFLTPSGSAILENFLNEARQ